MILNIEPTEREAEFIAAYFEAVEFTEEKQGRELAPEFERESIIDCLAFFQHVACFIDSENTEQAGHDFWFTRNRHGVGFWDRPEVYGQSYADLFTKKAHEFGEVCADFKANPIRESIAQNPFTDWGGYERFAITDDGGVLCFKCCQTEADCIDTAFSGDGWNIEGESHTGEADGPINCDHCNREILAEGE